MVPDLLESTFVAQGWKHMEEGGLTGPELAAWGWRDWSLQVSEPANQLASD